MVTRGDVWLVALDPTRGSEVRKTRPCVVVSPPEIHEHLRTVIVAPMSTNGRRTPFRIPITFRQKDGLVLLDQIRTVDKARLVKKEGVVANETLLSALHTLQEVFAE